MASLNQATRTAPGNPERIPGTLERTDHACSRLRELRDRLENISRNLHGPRPESANEKAAAPNSLRSYLESVHDLLTACEDEVQQIYASLGIS